MISSSLFMWAFVAGILFSVPPGPALTAVLSGCRQSARTALFAAFQVFFADLVVTSVCLLLYRPLSSFTHSPWIRLTGGIFLILFALYSFYSAHRKKILPKPNAAFHLTLLNPGVWLSMLTLIALLFDPEGSAFSFLFLFAVAFETGVLTWYLFLILVASKLSEKAHEIMIKLSFGIIGCTGLVFVIRYGLMLHF